jgi:PAS domain S-box-containing protein
MSSFVPALVAGGMSNDDVMVEYLDLNRNPGPEFRARKRELLLGQYAGRELDLIVAAQLPALAFLLGDLAEVAPEAPVLALNAAVPEGAATGRHHFLQQTVNMDFDGTIALALRLFPLTRRVVFANGCSEADRAANREAEHLERWRGRLEVEIIGDATFAQTLARLGTLPPRSIVVLGSYNKDSTGATFVTLEAMRRFSEAADAPTFTLFDVGVGVGSVGGSVFSIQREAQRTARLALAIARGERTLTETVAPLPWTPEAMVDWAQLQHWHGDPGGLPADAIVINRPPTLWEQHRAVVSVAGAAFALLVVLIGGLLVQNRRRRHAENAARESEARYRVLVEQAPDAIVVLDLDLERFVDANARAEQLFGCSRAELLASGPQRFYQDAQPDGRAPHDSIREHATRVLAGEELVFERLVRTAAGQELRCEVRLVRLPAGERRLIRASYVDITERKRIEAELQRYRGQLEELVAARSAALERERRLAEQYFTVARSMTVTLDRAGRVTRINPYGCELLGWPATELIGRDWFATCLPAATRERVKAYFHDLLATGDAQERERFEQQTYENEVVTRSGERRHLLFRNAFLRDDAGGVAGTLSSAIDITDSKQAEAALREAMEAADAANRAKSEFLSSMSHEIRTPLNAVLGYAQLLTRDPTLAEAHRKAVEVINRSGEHLLALINDILEMSRIEAGHSACDPGDFDLHALLDNLRSLFLMRARDRGLGLSVTLAPGLPQFVRSDERKLRQVLFNLLSNAVKFTSAGEVAVDASLRDGRLRIAVRDTGEGIAPAELRQLFQPFVQAQAGRRRGEGSGLGLALSRGFARILGGELGAESVLGAGSTFLLSIPVEIGERTGRGPEAPRQAVGLEPGQRPPRLLIAEDHAGSRDALSDLFLGIGCEVHAVADGVAAVEAWRSYRPDLIWMDIDMPRLDGLGAARAIRAEAGAAPPVIIACTAAAFAADRERILAGGCDEVVNKPYRENELFEAMERLLGTRLVWKRPAPVAPPAPGPSDAELAARLAALPEAERASLQKALVTGDLAAIAALTAAWSDRRLAGDIRALADGFDLNRLLAVLGRATGGALP